VVSRVALQLNREAEDAGLHEIQLEEQADLTPARAIQSRLEQIVTNLVLNGIQQTTRQKYALKQLADKQGVSFPLLQHGQVIILTRQEQKPTPGPIQIIVIDTGPGIHLHQQGELFLLDKSSRQAGHGLGLFISQNLAQNMGGRVRLADSVMFIGSAFVVELPVFAGDRRQE
jgi:signal transduction histidine kinase